MLTPRRLLRRVRALLGGSRMDQELDEELAFHLQMDTEARVRYGTSPEQARSAAERSLAPPRVKDEARDARGVRPVEEFLTDLRIAVRGLLRKPAFTAATLATFALGVGGVAAVFGAVHGILLRPLPYGDPGGLVVALEYNRRLAESQEVSPANFLDWRKRAASLDLAGAEPYGLDWLSDEGPVHLSTWLVSERFFDILDVPVLHGRTFRPDEHLAGGGQVVVLGWALWQRAFGGDPGVVGRRLTLDGQSYEVVGVMPRSFDLPAGNDLLWAPKVPQGWEATSRSSPFYGVIGRIRPGVTMEQAQADMDRVSSQLAQEYPQTNADIGARLVGLHEHLVGGARRGLLLLLGAVALMMLVAAANITSLQLARALDRGREFAVRTALGARRGRVTRQLIAESLLLAALGSALGFGLAALGLVAIRGLAPPELPRPEGLQVDAMILLVALGVAFGTAVLSGLVPAVVATRADPARGLGSEGRAFTVGRTTRRFRNLLVTSQFAVTLILVVGAGLLLRSFSALINENRGFRSDRVLVMVAQAWSYFPTAEARAEFVRQALDAIGAIPGVTAAGMTTAIPLGESIAAEEASITIPGRPVDPGAIPQVHLTIATGGFFDALRIPVTAGRSFGAQDRTGTGPVAVVNAAFARRFFGGEDPVGKRIAVVARGTAVEREIVGVVGDVRRHALHEGARPGVYLPHAQAPSGAVGFVVRTAGNPDAMAAPVQQAIWTFNTSMPVASVTTMDRLVGESLRDRRFLLALIGTFALVGLMLAATGIFGVMSYIMGERTREIGVRMAFGADRGRVLGMVLRDGGRLALAGILLGVGGALLTTRLLTGMLYAVGPLDPISFSAGALVLLGVAVAASWIPARRAAGLDPVEALRAE